MDISSITQTSAAGGQPVVNPQSQLGKDDFLKLLTVQLRYQDPLNPMEHTEFIAQMAQFTSLEQLQNMNAMLEQSVGAQTRMQGTVKENMAASLIGRLIDVPTSEVDYDGRASTSMGYRLPANSREAQVRILDATGRLVVHIDLDTSVTAGTFTWDGKSASGDSVPEGAYLVAIQAEDYAGVQLGGQVMRGIRVQGVRYTEAGAVLWGDGMELPLDELSGVSASLVSDR
jgi:flagellar basal-body rod modification protein FlgD